jgi:hypothetical protein
MSRIETGTMAAASFERFAGLCAILAGVATFLYSIGFVVLQRNASTAEAGTLLYSGAQLLGGIFTSAVMVALYNRLRDVSSGFAMWGLLLGLVGAAGSAIHGGYSLANAINPPGVDPLSDANLPNLVDPRGLLTFGVAGLALFIMSWLMTYSRTFPRSLAYLGYATAALLVILYVSRLTILDATNMAVVIPALLTGFIANPAFFIWLGLTMREKTREA